MYRSACIALLSMLTLAGSARAAGLEVRFYPAKALHAYELEGQRGLSGALLQNAAIVNRSGGPIALERIEIELLQGGEAVQTHRLGAADLERAAARGAAIEASGMMAQLAFQFRPDQLFGPGVKLAPGRELPANGALFLGHRFFSFSGKPERLRLRAVGRAAGSGASVEATGELPLAGPSRNEYLFPLAGVWFAGAGPSLHTSHRWGVMEEFALDVVRLGEGGLSHRGDGAKRGDYFAYGAPVRAAADGTVLAVEGAIPETDADLRQPGESAEAYFGRVLQNQAEIIAGGFLRAIGNYVVVEHANGEFSAYAHLQPGSVQVMKGDAVKRGQPIAKLGHSGNSTEPHLHFQVTDGPDPVLSAGIPIRFTGIELPYADGPRAIQSGDVVKAE
jgi:murein DD-endopeptidase MepM/ murein hydrolase activator NlpD